MTQAPLKGIRILDLTNVLAGPFCCHQLAHMGADVIKVETPGTGDLARQLGADPARNADLMGVSFLAQNPGKRSITLNLKSASGKRILKELVQKADVLVENFRPGVMARLNLDYDTLARENPRLVYCAISGFGQDGPLAKLPAYDQIVQGMSGVMSITGDANTAPYRVGYPMADTIGGMTAAFAVAAALANKAEDRGTFIDVSMLEAVIATMGWVVSNHLIASKTPTPNGNDNFTSSPSGTFKTADGVMNIAANKQEQFEALCEIIGNPALAQDPRFVDRKSRLANRSALTAELEAAFATAPTHEWVERLTVQGVPTGPVWSVPEALAHPQLADRGLLQTHRIGEQDLQLVGIGAKLDGVAPSVGSPPPALGAHTNDILSELGYDKAQISGLKKEGAI
ncbi:Acetyl-CoA:oxalate CoA-transferase (plasmid) [Pseudoseohaeicola sp. NH-UV-7]|jgi:formyl-CoA transferase|uniref:CaiB/BaiF CoA transferase family protein n=1 Tax=unclassified Sulfitobacter TaxID=196795 RepID=UPI000E0B6651|nr:CaiB/BaiF CoA-transferase family protein [Sulfitobacter sp. JL08]AXI54999.1 CoA transferase [Sulfitobacter sp. JL08]